MTSKIYKIRPAKFDESQLYALKCIFEGKVHILEWRHHDDHHTVWHYYGPLDKQFIEDILTDEQFAAWLKTPEEEMIFNKPEVFN